MTDLAVVQQAALPLGPDDSPPRPITPGRPKRSGTSRAERRRKSIILQAEGARRWIDAGKPVAVMVAHRDGFVTAETFRTAAADLGKLPPTYGAQRALSWLPALFAELVKERKLAKARRPDGSVIKRYSKDMGNDQVVYELAPEVRHG
jgi:hypothetical protein